MNTAPVPIAVDFLRGLDTPHDVRIIILLYHNICVRILFYLLLARQFENENL